MRITSRKARAGFSVIGASALVLVGCSPAPKAPAESAAAPSSDLLPCMVSDTGGFDDRSFNQLGAEGLAAGAAALGVDSNQVQSDTDADYAPNIAALLDSGCNLVLPVGIALADATVEAATAAPDVNFAIIDDTADLNFDGKTDVENIKPIVFDTAQAALLAGFAAASYSKTGIVGTYGGNPFPTVSVFMDGFAQGVEYYNNYKGTHVRVLGWDRSDPDSGTFIGTFDAGDESLAAANNLIDQGADVLLPVGGPIYQSAGEAIVDSGKDVVLIGCDADLFESDPKYADIYLTSIVKTIDTAVSEVIVDTAEKGFDNTPYLGTLENDGVSIAPFHNFDGQIADSTKSELAGIRKAIIDGDLMVQSYLATS